MLGTVGSPDREEPMVVVKQCPAATHGDEPRIADLGEDHEVAELVPVTVRAIELDRQSVRA
jgi:hypothetical protein